MTRSSRSPQRRPGGSGDRGPSPDGGGGGGTSEGSRIFIANLPMEVTESEVEDLFYKFGKIQDIEMRRDRFGDTSLAFVQFAESDAASEAIARRDGARVGSNNIRIEKARRKLRRPGDPRRGEDMPPRGYGWRGRGGHGGRGGGGHGGGGGDYYNSNSSSHNNYGRNQFGPPRR
ncbi:splicing factor sf2 [Cystoisospora suis]|uniref:Splicing factor sf2 n=1 Tax=Cystoisospora suis TaxID=483139 RepID=A0A2C6JGQ5_9APIC|nr:splicing factor sf2 [Cystoisospora suis]